MEDEIVAKLIYVQEARQNRIYLFCLCHGKQGVPVRKSVFGDFRQICHMSGCNRLIVNGNNGDLFPKGAQNPDGYMHVTDEMNQILGGRGGVAWEMSRNF